MSVNPDQIYAAFDRALLRDIQQEAKRRWPQLDMRRALVAMSPGRDQWFVEGRVDGAKVSKSVRANSAAHAKYKVWANLLYGDYAP